MKEGECGEVGVVEKDWYSEETEGAEDMLEKVEKSYLKGKN